MNALVVPDVLTSLKHKTSFKPHIINRLKEGHTPMSVATWLQQDLFEYTSTPKNILIEAVKEFFIEEVPIEERIQLVGKSNSLRRSVEKVRRQTSALEEMEFLYHVQVRRIEMGHEEETRLMDLLNSDEDLDRIVQAFDGEVEEGNKKKKRSVLNGSLDNSIETARRMLMDIHRMRQELGFDPKQSDKLDVNVTINGQNQTDLYKEKRAKIIHSAMSKLAASNEDIQDAEFKNVGE